MASPRWLQQQRERRIKPSQLMVKWGKIVDVAAKDGVSPSITVTYGNAHIENIGQSSTGPSLPTQETTLAGNTPNGMMNDANPRVDASAAMEDVSPSVVMVDEVVAKEKISPLVDTSGSYPPLPTQATSSAGNSLGHGKSSYANVTSKPNEKKLNIHTFFTPGVMGLMWSMDGLDAMLENGPWFIWNNPFIMKKWHPDENLLKEDVSTIPFWVKLPWCWIRCMVEVGYAVLGIGLARFLVKSWR
ncbi:hypothetical protein Tco_0128685 [Tanacetum coccineum]